MLNVKIDHDVCECVQMLLTVMFPMLDADEVVAISEQRLLNKQRMAGSVGTQLSLDLT